MNSKNLLYILLFVFAFASNNTTVAQQVIVTDSAAYTEPASGSVLDVASSTKGFMPPRIVLRDSTDKTKVTNPTEGLMVYNPGGSGKLAEGLYYWDGSVWLKALVGGSGPNSSLSISDNGTVTLNGSATTFEDLRVDGSRVANSGTSAPNWLPFVGNLYANLFSATAVNYVYFQVQMPHAWKAGSRIFPHVHWAPITSAPGTKRVYWELEYEWVNYQQPYGSPVTINGYLLAGESTPTRSLALLEHTITPLGTNGIDGTGKTISSVLMCRLARRGDDDVIDNFTERAALLSVDFHYEIDSFGSGSEYTK